MKTILKIFILSLLFTIPTEISARHIVGGTFSYKVLSTSNASADVEVILYLYRDNNSGGALFDENIELGIYKYLDSDYTFILRESVSISTVSTLEINGAEGCPGNVLHYQMATYVTHMTIPITDAEYFTIGYQRCCRDNLITNIVEPQETGMAISFDLYPSAFDILNKPVVMNHQFPMLTDVGVNSTFDLAVEDGFKKEYILSTPKVAGGILGSIVPGDPTDCEGITPDVENCQPEFAEVEYIDENNPYGIDAIIEIDKESGVMDVEIPSVSKVLVGLTIDNYSEDEIVSRMRQQFIINALDCSMTNTNEFFGNKFIMWPSPTRDKVYFEQQLYDVFVTDSNGNKIDLNQTQRSVSELNLSHLPSGIYMVKGHTQDDIQIIEKVIKLD